MAAADEVVALLKKAGDKGLFVQKMERDLSMAENKLGMQLTGRAKNIASPSIMQEETSLPINQRGVLGKPNMDKWRK